MNLPASPEIRALRYNPKLKPWDYIPGLLYKPGKVFAAIRLRGPRIWDWLLPVILVIASFLALFAISALVETQVADVPVTWDFVQMVFLGLAMVSGLPLIMGVALFLVGQMFGVKRLGVSESLAIAGNWVYILLVMYIIKLTLQMCFGISFTTSLVNWFGVEDNLLLGLILGVFEPTSIYFIILATIGAMNLGRTSVKRAILLPLGTYVITSLVIILYSFPVLIWDFATSVFSAL